MGLPPGFELKTIRFAARDRKLRADASASAVPLRLLAPQPLRLPRQEFGEPDLGRPDDFLVQRADERLKRRIRERLENPVAAVDPQVLERGERLLARSDDRNERDH